MAKIVKCDEFYEFETDQEAKSAQLLAPSNLQFIKNQLYYERKKKENLTLDLNNPAVFAQDEAFLKGAISAYQFLIDTHESLVQGISVDPSDHV